MDDNGSYLDMWHIGSLKLLIFGFCFVIGITVGR